jgi:hypothetical protein
MRTIKADDKHQGLTLYYRRGGEFCGIADRDGNYICGVQSFTVETDRMGIATVTLTANLYAPREHVDKVTGLGDAMLTQSDVKDFIDGLNSGDDNYTGADDIIPLEDIGPIIADIEKQCAEEIADDGVNNG